MSCSLCQSLTGHKPTCVEADPRYAVSWESVGTLWAELSRRLLGMMGDEVGGVRFWDMVRRMNEAITANDPKTALELLDSF
jgi:hypothetical protein